MDEDKARYDGWRVVVELNPYVDLDGADPLTLGIDTEASARAYVALVEDYFRRVAPGSDVSIVYRSDMLPDVFSWHVAGPMPDADDYKERRDSVRRAISSRLWRRRRELPRQVDGLRRRGHVPTGELS